MVHNHFPRSHVADLSSYLLILNYLVKTFTIVNYDSNFQTISPNQICAYYLIILIINFTLSFNAYKPLYFYTSSVGNLFISIEYELDYIYPRFTFV